jgi:hypothetical protein
MKCSSRWTRERTVSEIVNSIYCLGGSSHRSDALGISSQSPGLHFHTSSLPSSTLSQAFQHHQPCPHLLILLSSNTRYNTQAQVLAFFQYSASKSCHPLCYLHHQSILRSHLCDHHLPHLHTRSSRAGQGEAMCKRLDGGSTPQC